MEYFQFDSPLESWLKLILFLFFLVTYLRLKLNKKVDKDKVYNYFTTAMGLLALKFTLPLIVSIVWVQFFEEYLVYIQVLTFLSYYVPFLIAVVFFIKVANIKLSNA